MAAVDTRGTGNDVESSVENDPRGTERECWSENDLPACAVLELGGVVCCGKAVVVSAEGMRIHRIG